MSSVQIFLARGKTTLASGTAFVYERHGSLHLVTNWHNVTGRNSLTHEPLNKRTGALPNLLGIRFPIYQTRLDNPTQTNVAWIGKWLPLYSSDEEDQPVWHEHPQFGSDVDLATIPIAPFAENSAVIPVNSTELGYPNASVGAGSDAFILGFPHGISGGAHLPVWKRGSIASEPGVNVNRQPKMLVDSATRRGMSGSPVFAHVEGFSLPLGITDLGQATLGSTFQFLGCYSGSLGREPFEAQLGIVWKEEAIIEVIESAKLGVASKELFTKETAGNTTHSFFDWDDWAGLPNP